MYDFIGHWNPRKTNSSIFRSYKEWLTCVSSRSATCPPHSQDYVAARLLSRRPQHRYRAGVCSETRVPRYSAVLQTIGRPRVLIAGPSSSTECGELSLEIESPRVAIAVARRGG